MQVGTYLFLSASTSLSRKIRSVIRKLIIIRISPVVAELQMPHETVTDVTL